MDETNTKPIRRFLHLGKSVAPQVREQAARWGLGEMEAIHQLIRLGLRASSEGVGSGAKDVEVRQIKQLVMEVLRNQLETLLYQRDTTVDAMLIPFIHQRLTAVEATLGDMGSDSTSNPKAGAVATSSEKRRDPVEANDAGAGATSTDKKKRDQALDKLDSRVREVARAALPKILDRVLAPDASRPDS